MVPAPVRGYILVHGSREEMDTGNTISGFKRVEVCACSETRLTTVHTEDRIRSADWTHLRCCGGRMWCLLSVPKIYWVRSLLAYADDTDLMAESEELKSLLIKMREESWLKAQHLKN